MWSAFHPTLFTLQLKRTQKNVLHFNLTFINLHVGVQAVK